MAAGKTFTVIKNVQFVALLSFPAEKGFQYFLVGSVSYNDHFNRFIRITVYDLTRIIIENSFFKSVGKKR